MQTATPQRNLYSTEGQVIEGDEKRLGNRGDMSGMHSQKDPIDRPSCSLIPANITHVDTLQPPYLDNLFSTQSVEERINMWAANDSVLRRFDGLKGWENVPLNHYDSSHVKNDEERAALKVSNLIMKLCPEEFYETHPFMGNVDNARALIEYLQAESYWMDEAAKIAINKDVQNTGRRSGRYEIGLKREEKIRRAVCSSQHLHHRFRAFFFVYHNVLGQTPEYHVRR